MKPSLQNLVAILFYAVILFEQSSNGQQLSPTFYEHTCPRVKQIASEVIKNATKTDARTTATLVRLQFFDCFSQGCDASVLLDGANIEFERSFKAVDQIKAAVEIECSPPGVVSCADIITIAAAESVALAGGPSWEVFLGRRDSLTGNKSRANLPSPYDSLENLKSKFEKAGLDGSTDLVALSGAHTFGKAECSKFMDRLYNFSDSGGPDPTLNKPYLEYLQKLCPSGGHDTVTAADLDRTTPRLFDNKYYYNLENQEGLLRSDQELILTPGADTTAIVNYYSSNQTAFFEDFVSSMIRLAELGVSTGSDGEVRLNCRKPNGYIKQVV